jgi:hypothetical protein
MPDYASRRHCSICKLPLGNGSQTVAEVSALYPDRRHENCTLLIEDFTSSVAGFIVNLIANSQRSAKERGVEWKLGDHDAAFAYLLDLYKRQQGRCAISGREFKIARLTGYDFNLAPSLDRIYSDRAYEVGNVRFVLRCLNYGKSNLPPEEFVAIICDAADLARRGSAQLTSAD